MVILMLASWALWALLKFHESTTVEAESQWISLLFKSLDCLVGTSLFALDRSIDLPFDERQF